jgi:hypothetical protein
MLLTKKAFKYQRHHVASSNGDEAAARTRSTESHVIITIGDKHEVFITHAEWEAIAAKVERLKTESDERAERSNRRTAARAIAGEYLNRFALALRDGKSPDDCPRLRSNLPSIALKLGLDIECLGGPHKFEEDAREIIRDIIIGPGYEAILAATKARK